MQDTNCFTFFVWLTKEFKRKRRYYVCMSSQAYHNKYWHETLCVKFSFSSFIWNTPFSLFTLVLSVQRHSCVGRVMQPFESLSFYIYVLSGSSCNMLLYLEDVTQKTVVRICSLKIRLLQLLFGRLPKASSFKIPEGPGQWCHFARPFVQTPKSLRGSVFALA